ncbi:transcription elongation factor GreA [Hyphomicrobium methylovorum]|uniref:transcription elongation factor GreA n=1 Tax=Hyphomicrobium methylovorum TaxID=84 RepID=UPI0015E6D42D|nr:transcription elongation factor GreA [Hyphomicrobium methylovorum]MBA2124833.1 transcription elongation factor GreA [Hyphomicrobium methylovorum]
MSRAFVKETDAVEDLPDRLVSEHRNLVTPEGLTMIEREIERLQVELSAAHESDDRDGVGRANRDLRYWRNRQSTAEVQPAVSNMNAVMFGARVTLERDDGRVQTYRIVGEDEADPARGSISYVSPLAQALLDKSVGDTVKAGAGEAEIIRIE